MWREKLSSLKGWAINACNEGKLIVEQQQLTGVIIYFYKTILNLLDSDTLWIGLSFQSNRSRTPISRCPVPGVVNFKSVGRQQTSYNSRWATNTLVLLLSFRAILHENRDVIDGKSVKTTETTTVKLLPYTSSTKRGLEDSSTTLKPKKRNKLDRETLRSELRKQINCCWIHLNRVAI